RRTLLPSGDLEQRLDMLNYSETFYEADVQFGSRCGLGGIEHKLTYGFDGDHVETEYERVDITNNLTAGTSAVAVAGGFNFANSATTRADVYLQDEFALWDGRLTLIPGLRHSYYKITPYPDANYQIVPGAEPRQMEESDL